MADTACAYDERYWEDRYAHNGNSFDWYDSSTLVDVSALVAPGSRILDLGCGTSAAPLQLACAGHAVTAVDYSASAIRAQQTALDSLERPCCGSLILLLEDARSLSLPDGSFDAVLDKATLDSLDCVKGTAQAVSETHRVLRPGGLLFSVSCRDREERLAALAAHFELQEPGVMEVWKEGRSAPCATYWKAAFRRREDSLELPPAG
jgi:ubiquinone/menaquinone biosynthesis C-methylase UbiE